MATDQNFKNHARFDPLFHFITLPILLLNLIFSIYATIKHWPEHPHMYIWWIVMSFAFMMIAFKARTYALKAQDRIIRLGGAPLYPTLMVSLGSRLRPLREAHRRPVHRPPVCL